MSLNARNPLGRYIIFYLHFKSDRVQKMIKFLAFFFNLLFKFSHKLRNLKNLFVKLNVNNNKKRLRLLIISFLE